MTLDFPISKENKGEKKTRRRKWEGRKRREEKREEEEEKVRAESEERIEAGREAEGEWEEGERLGEERTGMAEANGGLRGRGEKKKSKNAHIRNMPFQNCLDFFFPCIVFKRQTLELANMKNEVYSQGSMAKGKEQHSPRDTRTVKYQ